MECYIHMRQCKRVSLAANVISHPQQSYVWSGLMYIMSLWRTIRHCKDSLTLVCMGKLVQLATMVHYVVL